MMYNDPESRRRYPLLEVRDRRLEFLNVPAQHPRSIRAIAMALQAVLARAGDALPDVRHVIELEIDGEHLQIVLDARPSASAGPSTDADARIRVPRSTMSDFLLGRSFDKKRFVHISGSKAARTALIRALGTMTTPRSHGSPVSRI